MLQKVQVGARTMILVGLSFRDAPVAVRESLVLDEDGVAATLHRLIEQCDVSEALVLPTCNRCEIYAVADDESSEDVVMRAIVDLLVDIGGQGIASFLNTARGPDAVRHMFRVAASLDSLVLGEPHILGQFKQAVQRSEHEGAMGPKLRHAARCAIRVAKRVRRETTIGEGRASVPGVAVCLAEKIFEDLSQQAVLLVGAGNMAETCAKLLRHAGARVTVINRTAARAERLAALVDGRAAPWSAMDRLLLDADIVITSTSSRQHVLTAEQVDRVRAARKGRSLFVIDIAVPRDAEPSIALLDGVFLYDVDDLSAVVNETVGQRAAVLDQAEAMIGAELDSYAARQREQAITPVIVGLREKTRQVLAAELDRSLRGRLKHLSEPDRQALQAMLASATNKLLHDPTTRLRSLAHESGCHREMELLRNLFALATPT